MCIRWACKLCPELFANKTELCLNRYISDLLNFIVLTFDNILCCNNHLYLVVCNFTNSCFVQLQKDLTEPMPGYLSLHQSAHSLTIKWTPNQLMNGYSEAEIQDKR